MRTYPPCWVLKVWIEKHRGITQHTGPTALCPIRRTKQLWLSVLLKDTSVTTSQARIWTHILTTSELESNALDRSATTLHSIHVLKEQNRQEQNRLSTGHGIGVLV